VKIPNKNALTPGANITIAIIVIKAKAKIDLFTHKDLRAFLASYL